MKVKEVEYVSGFTIRVTFSDGVCGIINLEGLVTKGVFKGLADKAKFEKVYNTGYSIAWSDELEIDALALYMEITGKQDLMENWERARNHETLNKIEPLV
jgi:hypothetical protein